MAKPRWARGEVKILTAVRVEQKKAVEDAARKAGLSVSELLRRIIFTKQGTSAEVRVPNDLRA